MSVYDDRQNAKVLREKYKEVARRQLLQPDDECILKIPQHSHIQFTEDGAFVEAQVWVPKERIHD